MSLKLYCPKRLLLLRWISDWFFKADINKDGRMNFKETKTLLKMMNIDMNEEHASNLFKVIICLHTQLPAFASI